MTGSRRAQAATEYLIILAIVIVIALVVVGAMGGIPRLGGSTSSRTSASYWQQADIGITASFFNTTDGSIVVKNNLPYKVRIDSFSIGSDYTAVSASLPRSLASGKAATVTFTNASALVAGDVSYTVTATYTNLDSGLGPYSFTGDERLIGKIQ